MPTVQITREKVFEDKAQVHMRSRAMESMRIFANQFKDTFENLPNASKSIKDTTDLQACISNPKGFYEALIMSKMPSVSYGLPTNKSEKLAGLILPEFSDVNDLRTRIFKAAEEYNPFVPIEILQVTGNAVTLNAEMYENYLSEFQTWANTPEELEYVAKIREFVNKFKELKEYHDYLFPLNKLPIRTGNLQLGLLMTSDMEVNYQLFRQSFGK